MSHSLSWAETMSHSLSWAETMSHSLSWAETISQFETSGPFQKEIQHPAAC